MASVGTVPARAATCGDYRIPHTDAAYLNIKTSGISCAATKRALHRYHEAGKGLNCRQAAAGAGAARAGRP
jgi:hypothetical protein